MGTPVMAMQRWYKELGPTQSGYQEYPECFRVWPAKQLPRPHNKDDAIQETKRALLPVWPARAHQGKLPKLPPTS